MRYSKMKSTVQSYTHQNVEGCGTVEWQTTRTVRKQSGLRTKPEESTFSTRTEKSIKKEKFCSFLRKK